MNSFTYRIVLGLVALYAVQNCLGRIGDTPKEMEGRFGHPITAQFDREGNGLALYPPPQPFRELRVMFEAGRSCQEKFSVQYNETIPESVVNELRKEVSGDKSFFDGSTYITIGEPARHDELKFVNQTGATETYRGKIQFGMCGNAKILVLHDGEKVVEFGFRIQESVLRNVAEGALCEVTARDNLSDDLWSGDLVSVAKRTHVDWSDAVEDPDGKLQTLTHVRCQGRMLYDEAHCEVHGWPMLKVPVSIAYGMLAWSAAEDFCNNHYPHWRTFAVGGCIVGDKEQTTTFVCPQCYIKAKAYLEVHPDPNP